MSDQILPFNTVRTYTTFTSDIDLMAVAPGGGLAIYVSDIGSGTLAVKYADGTEESYTFTKVGYLDPRPAQYLTILAATNVGEIRVGF